MDSSKVVTRTTTTKTSGKKGYGYETNTLNDNWFHDGNEPNINQLDTLLQDLKSERTISRDKELFELSRNQSGNASASASYEYDTIIRDTKQLSPMKSSYYEERSFQNIKSSTPEPKYKKVSLREEFVERKIEGDDEPDFSSSVMKKSNNSSYGRVLPYDEHEKLIPSISEPNYKTITMREEIVKQQRQPTRDFEPEYSSLKKSAYDESTRTFESKNIVNNNNNNNVTTLEQYISPEELQKISISENILPAPGTKVTTTVRTYTYEIPGDPASVSTNKETILTSNRQNNVVYNDRSRSPLPNTQLENYQYSETNTSSRSTLPVQKTVSNINKTSHITDLDSTIPRNLHPAPPGYRPDQSHLESYYYKDESNTVMHPPEIDRTPVVSSYTIRNNTIDRRYIEEPPRGPKVTSYVVHNVNNTTTDRHYPDEPPRTTPVTTTYTVHNVHNNTIDRRFPEEPPQIPTQTTYSTIHNVHNTIDRRYPEPPPHPNTHVTTYKYSSTTSNRGPQNDTSLQPFPVDGLPHTAPINDKSPTHLNDLLSSFGNENNGDVIDTSYNPKHEVETAVAKRSTPNQQVVPSKNIAGPPVYYPPGHELSLRKEESSAAWRAGGGYAKASGRYEYEAESKSKSKSSSGAAVVPVCLPLCCAMPCTIM